MNTKDRGDIALGVAINYYLSNGFEVSLPIGNKRDYDLIIEQFGVLKRVQVKFAGVYSDKKKCKVGLRITGGNQSYNYAKKYNDDAFELLFVYTGKGERYNIPWNEVNCRNEISIETRKWQKYKITI